jgi:hypothetical protein
MISWLESTINDNPCWQDVPPLQRGIYLNSDVALGYVHPGIANAQIGAQHGKSPTQANHPVHKDKLEGGGERAEERGSYHPSALGICTS